MGQGGRRAALALCTRLSVLKRPPVGRPAGWSLRSTSVNSQVGLGLRRRAGRAELVRSPAWEIKTVSLPPPTPTPSSAQRHSCTLSEVGSWQLQGFSWQNKPGRPLGPELLNATWAGGPSLPSGPAAGDPPAQTQTPGHRGRQTLRGHALTEAGFGWWPGHKRNTPGPELPPVGVRGQLYVGYNSWGWWEGGGGDDNFFLRTPVEMSPRSCENILQISHPGQRVEGRVCSRAWGGRSVFSSSLKESEVDTTLKHRAAFTPSHEPSRGPQASSFPLAVFLNTQSSCISHETPTLSPRGESGR